MRYLIKIKANIIIYLFFIIHLLSKIHLNLIKKLKVLWIPDGCNVEISDNVIVTFLFCPTQVRSSKNLES